MKLKTIFFSCILVSIFFTCRDVKKENETTNDNAESIENVEVSNVNELPNNNEASDNLDKEMKELDDAIKDLKNN